MVSVTFPETNITPGKLIGRWIFPFGIGLFFRGFHSLLVFWGGSQPVDSRRRQVAHWSDAFVVPLAHPLPSEALPMPLATVRVPLRRPCVAGALDSHMTFGGDD